MKLKTWDMEEKEVVYIGVKGTHVQVRTRTLGRGTSAHLSIEGFE
jgi:hypothetical protein